MSANKYKDKLILGTVQFGLNYGINNTTGKIDTESVNKILDYAYDNQIYLLDTADAYGDSQSKIGNYHRQNPNKRFKILTKFKGVESDKLVEHTRNVLELLAVEKLECLSLHDFSELKKSSVFLNYNKLKELGLTQKIGVSVYTPDECIEALSNELVDTVQIPFNILDNENRWAQAFEFREKIKRPTEIHSRSCFLQGLLYKNTQQILSDTPYLKDLAGSLQEARSEAEKFNKTAAEYSINYCFQNTNISAVLIGVDSIEQLIQNLTAIEKSLPQDAFKKINNIQIRNPDLLNPSKWPALKEQLL